MDGRIAPRWRLGTVALCLGLSAIAQAAPAPATAGLQVAQATLDDGLGRIAAPRVVAPPPAGRVDRSVKAASLAAAAAAETEPLLILAAGIAGLGWLRHLAKVRRAP